MTSSEIRAARAAYHRRRSLEWLADKFFHVGGKVWAETLRSGTIEARQVIVAELERRSRIWRKMGLDGHWAYSLPCHRELNSIIDRERALIVEATAAGTALAA